ncbi:MAG: hypothetical protein RR839_00615, partial [Oscillospiraceae bacterium]
EQDDEAYAEMIDDTNEMVIVCGMEYYPSTVLKEVNPIAYNCGFSDFQSSIIDDITYEIENAEIGDTIKNYGFEIEIVDEEE